VLGGGSCGGLNAFSLNPEVEGDDEAGECAGDVVAPDEFSIFPLEKRNKNKIKNVTVYVNVVFYFENCDTMQRRRLSRVTA
jgi:hypothetical protein